MAALEVMITLHLRVVVKSSRGNLKRIYGSMICLHCVVENMLEHCIANKLYCAVCQKYEYWMHGMNFKALLMCLNYWVG